MPCISSHDASSPRPAKGFTLVELLVSITILVILATVTLYGMASVQKMAQIQRAKSQVARIHELIMDKWESYETRRAGPLAAPYDDPNHPWPIGFRRLLGLRELMRLEMPDRYSDISPAALELLAQRPGLSRYYERRLNGGTDVQPAECLYMIISRMSVGDASALEFFSEEEIGDADGDGLPEILDPWGNPITFLRWPAGFEPSPLMSPDDFGDPFDLLGLDDKAVIADDPMNTMFDRDDDGAAPPDADDRPFALVPLIMSAGPDKAFDIDIGDIDYSSPAPPQQFPNDPYAYIVAGAGYPPDQQLTRVGAIADTNQDGVPNHLDNIHNHLISTSIK